MGLQKYSVIWVVTLKGNVQQ